MKCPYLINVGADSNLLMKATDESEDGSDMSDHEDGEDSFMHSYSDVMNNELKNTTLKNSFVHANEQTSVKNEVPFCLLSRDTLVDLTDMPIFYNLCHAFCWSRI